MPFLTDPPLRVGDHLRIVCPEVPEICVERTVGPDGTVDVPGIGPLAAAFRTSQELGRSLAERLPCVARLPRVQIRWIGSASGEISVSGAVERPLRVFAPHGIDTDRLLQAAGILDDADRTLVTTAGRVRPGTTLDVPLIASERRISVLGGVVSPRSLPPADNLLLSSVLDAVGGLTPHGDPNGIVVVRSGESIPVQLPLDASFHLSPGDVVRVGLVADRGYVSVKGLVVRPGSVEYAPGMTATLALAAAGGLAAGVRDGSLVWQTGPKTYRLSLAFLLARRIPDPVLGANDTIIVEAAKR